MIRYTLRNVREINRMPLISQNSISDVLCTPEVHGIKKVVSQRLFLRDKEKKSNLCATLKKTKASIPIVQINTGNY